MKLALAALAVLIGDPATTKTAPCSGKDCAPVVRSCSPKNLKCATVAARDEINPQPLPPGRRRRPVSQR